MRVPPEPEPPPGEGTRVFRAAPNYFRYKLVLWLLSQFTALVGLLLGFYLINNVNFRIRPVSQEQLHWVLTALETLGAGGFLLQLPFSLAVAVLDFEMRWYMVTDRSLRIREGIVNVREKTMTFANIQNITVRQGPLQRFLGIADVEVRNAGGGASSPDSNKHGQSELVHVGYFRGVDQAETIRDTIFEGVRRQRDSGLGDPEERGHRVAETARVAVNGLADAALAFRNEARSLRAALER